MPDLRTLTLSEATIELVLMSLDATADDRREPERYRDWYAEAASEVRRAIGQADGQDSADIDPDTLDGVQTAIYEAGYIAGRAMVGDQLRGWLSRHVIPQETSE